MAVKLLLVDDHRMFREGLAVLLSSDSRFSVVGQAKDGSEVLSLVEQLHPEVVLMDVAMSGINGSEATRLIVSRYPNVKVIAVSMHSDQRFVTSMLEAGAVGYVLKDSAFEELALAIETVVDHRTYLSAAVADVVVKGYMNHLTGKQEGRSPELTAREIEVLRLLAEGRGTKDIAASLQISVKTIETHRKNIMVKLDLHSVAELTKYAIREGFTTLGV